MFPKRFIEFHVINYHFSLSIYQKLGKKMKDNVQRLLSGNYFIITQYFVSIDLIDLLI